MDPRQRGVAHVNIFWCLVPLVLMFGAGGYAYVKHVEADENLAARQAADAKEDAMRQRFAHREKQLQELTGVLGNPGEFTAPLVPIPDYKPPTNYTTPKKLNDAFAEFANAMNAPSALTKLDDLLGSARQTLQAKDKEIAALQGKLAEARAATDQARRSVDDVRNEMNTKVTELEGQVRSEQNRIDRTTAAHATELSQQRERTNRATEERESAIKDAQVKAAAFEKEITNLHAANQRKADLVRLINSPDDPDGRVLSASPDTGLAWIDIGARDGVKAGLTFQIREPLPQGKYRVKGECYVLSTERDRSQVKVTSLNDKYNPVVRMDIVANDLFTPGLKRNVYLLGRFATPLSKPEIKKILESMGHSVIDEMGPTVDLVIVGRENIGEDATKLAETAEYKMAANHDIEIAPLVKIRDFLRL